MADVVVLMMTLRDQIKLYHWQTTAFPRHKATDELVEKLDSNIDKFVETYIGTYGRPVLTKANIRLRGFRDSEAPKLLNEALEWLKKLKLTSDLLNIRDEIMSDVHQTLYLFTLR